MNTKKNSKILALLLALAMVFVMSVPAFASTGNCTVKFYVPTQYMDEYGGGTGNVEIVTPTLPDSYTNSQYSNSYVHPDGIAVNGTLKTKTADINLGEINGWLVTPPEGFHGLYNYNPNETYIPTVFDAIYKAGTITGETATSLTYGFDTYAVSTSGVPMHGIYFNTISGLGNDQFDTYYDPTDNSGYWIGYSWNLYVVPENVSFNPAAGQHDDTYKSDLYANNVAASAGYTYYMIYEYTEIYY